jgi:hydroxymethylbilane synthase
VHQRRKNRVVKKIVVGSRASRLAVIQSELVMKEIGSAFPEAELSLVTMKTTGDKILDKTLDQIGGKGLFVKELDEALRRGEADLTVHSLKDLPMDVPEDIPLAAFSVREDPRDVLILPEGKAELDMALPVGTSSKRRALQIKELYPGAVTAPVRGNVETRLRKLDEGQYSALVMAAAGIRRLGLEHRISRTFEPDELVPASCQGIMGMQARADDGYLMDTVLPAINCRESELSAAAERSFVRTIGADCGSADTSFSWVEDGKMYIIGLRYDAENGRIIRDRITGDPENAAELGRELAERLLAQ